MVESSVGLHNNWNGNDEDGNSISLSFYVEWGRLLTVPSRVVLN